MYPQDVESLVWALFLNTSFHICQSQLQALLTRSVDSGMPHDLIAENIAGFRQEMKRQITSDATMLFEIWKARPRP